MSRKGFVRNFKPLQILTEEQVESLKRGTLHVLEKTGLRVEHKQALELLEKNGCRVDRAEMRVRVPAGLVEECIGRCPSHVLIRARDPQNDVLVGGSTLYFKNSSGMQTIDLDSYEPRVPTRKENYDAVTVLDSLPNLDLLGPYTPYFGFEGIPQAMSIPESIASRLRSSTKALVGGSLNGSEVFTIQMAQALGTEILHAISASPPLTWYHQPIEALYRIVAAGFPMRIVGGQMFGGTAPATLSGALVTNNAEIILAVVVAQLLKPGTRIIVDDFVSPLNMKTGSPAFSDIGISLHHAAFNQVWRSYGLPMCNLSCGYINSKRIDYQTGYEKAISVVLSAVSGTSYIGMHGSVSAELTFHPLQAILDDDVAGMIGRFLEGMQVNDETLALDLINQVGPVPGMYLDKEHTRKWWSKEQYVPVAADRLTYTTWKESGKKSCLDYAGDRMEEILATHRCTPLSPGQEEDIKRILEEATLYFKEKGLISAEEMTAYRKALKGATD